MGTALFILIILFTGCTVRTHLETVRLEQGGYVVRYLYDDGLGSKYIKEEVFSTERGAENFVKVLEMED